MLLGSSYSTTSNKDFSNLLLYKKVNNKFKAVLQVDKQVIEKYLINFTSKLSESDLTISANKSKITLIKSVLKKINQNQLIIKFGYKDILGRISCLNKPNIQTLSTELRNLILGNNSIEIDLVSCHPVIYYNLVTKLVGFEMPLLEKYIVNKNELADYLETDVSIVKLMVLKAMNGGKININNTKVSSFKDELVESKNRLYTKLISDFPDLYREFHYKITGYNTNDYTSIMKYRSPYNLESKIINRFLRYIESNILDLLLSKLYELRIENLSIIPLHDGLILSKGKDELRSIFQYNKEAFLSQLEADIHSYFNIRIKLGIKEVIPPTIVDDDDGYDSLGLGYDTDDTDTEEKESVKNTDDKTMETNTDNASEDTTGFNDLGSDELSELIIDRDPNQTYVEQLSGLVNLTISSSEDIMDRSDYDLAMIMVKTIRRYRFFLKDKDDQLWLFEDGVWIRNVKIIETILTNIIANSELGYYKDGEFYRVKDNYPYVKRISEYTIELIPKTNVYMMKKIQQGSLNKLLLSCGNVYNWESKSFRPVDFKIDHFAAKMTFSKDDLLSITENDVEEWCSLYFNNTYNEEDLPYLYHWLSTSISGINAYWKISLFILGDRDSGKTILLNLLNHTFENQIASHINGGHIQKTKINMELERAMAFCQDFYYRRLATFSEFSKEIPFNEKIVKMIQGMESVFSRNLYEKPIKVPTSTSMLFVNNNLVLGPKEIYDHIEVIETPKVFKFKGLEDKYKDTEDNKDSSLINQLTTHKGKCCFVVLLMKYWSNHPIKPTASMKNLKENLIISDIGYAKVMNFHEFFVIDPNNYITFSSLQTWLSIYKKNMEMNESEKDEKNSARKITLYDTIKLIKANGGINKRIVVDNKRIRVIWGVGFRY